MRLWDKLKTKVMIAATDAAINVAIGLANSFRKAWVSGDGWITRPMCASMKARVALVSSQPSWIIGLFVRRWRLAIFDLTARDIDHELGELCRVAGAFVGAVRHLQVDE